MTLTLDNLVTGQTFPANSELGTPAGTITEVTNRPCGDHAAWRRDCPNCEVAWREEYVGGTPGGRVVLSNEYLWTDAERAAWDAAETSPAPAPEFDPWASS